MIPLANYLKYAKNVPNKSLFPDQARNHSNVCRFVYNKSFKNTFFMTL